VLYGDQLQTAARQQETPNMKIFAQSALILALTMPTFAIAGETPSAPGAKVFFVNVKDGDTVTSPFKVEFGVEGMSIVPAETDQVNSGHHHLFIDRPALGKTEDGAEELANNIIKDEKNVHFGKGQTDTMVELPAGKHTLQMVLGDKDHIPHNPPLATEVITITVQ
jgi:Domain of unknown function (DUF4399)